MSVWVSKVALTFGFVSGGWKTFKLMRKVEKVREILIRGGYSPEVVDYEVERFHGDHMKPMLMFWCALAIVNVYDSYLEPLISWFPFYDLAKTIFVVWLTTPQTKGAVVLFEQFIQPAFQRFHKFVEERAKPLVRQILLTRAYALQNVVMNGSLQAVSGTELHVLHSTLDTLLIELNREKDRRKEREELEKLGRLKTVRTLSEDFRRRLVEGVDLDDFDSDDESWAVMDAKTSSSGIFSLWSAWGRKTKSVVKSKPTTDEVAQKEAEKAE